MLVKMERSAFESLDDTSLIWACIEPTIRQIRGKAYMLKSGVYLQLNCGQQALLMYQILHGHSANGVEEFFGSLSYALSDEAFWKQFKKGMLYFRDDAMGSLVEDMKRVYPYFKNKEYEDDKERIDIMLSEILPGTTKLVAGYIRSHPDEFTVLTD